MPFKKTPSTGWRPGLFFTYLVGPAGTANLHRNRSSGLMSVTRRRASKRILTDAEEPAKQKCPCSRFKILDLYWQQHQAELRPIWDAAVKKSYMSGYELFMKESLTLCNLTGMLPSCPSPSGGYSTANLIPSDDEVPPPGGWLGKFEPPPPPPDRWHCTGPPEYLCVPDPDGEFETEAECVGLCTPTVSYMDPIADLAPLQWKVYNPPTGSHFSHVDDGVRQPAAPSSDEIYWNGLPNWVYDTYQMSDPGRPANSIIYWAYWKNWSGACDLCLRSRVGGVWQLQHRFVRTSASGFGWSSNSTDPTFGDWTPAQMADVQLEVAVNGEPTSIEVHAVYIEIQ